MVVVDGRTRGDAEHASRTQVSLRDGGSRRVGAQIAALYAGFGRWRRADVALGVGDDVRLRGARTDIEPGLGAPRVVPRCSCVRATRLLMGSPRGAGDIRHGVHASRVICDACCRILDRRPVSCGRTRLRRVVTLFIRLFTQVLRSPSGGRGGPAELAEPVHAPPRCAGACRCRALDSGGAAWLTPCARARSGLATTRLANLRNGSRAITSAR